MKPVLALCSLLCFSLPSFLSAETPQAGPKLVVDQDRARIMAAANAALEQAPTPITDHQSPLNPGTPNEFFSMSDYFWPDPSKPDGKPYIMRDGQSYPGNFNEHRVAMLDMKDATSALAAAYLLTHDEKFAAKAVELLRVFFIDPKTRMTPSLEQAQAIIGQATPDRGTGLIDTLHLIETPLAILALRDSKSMSADDFNALRQWFADYTRWFINSPRGKNEAKATNNHAVAYWLQVASFSTLTEDKALLDECRRQFKEVFVPVQMDLDGGFPLELGRTKPYAYSIFQLDLMAALCQLLSTPEDNLWAFTTGDGKWMTRALDFMVPFIADKSAWPKAPDVNAWEGWPVRQPALLFGGLAYKNPKCIDLWRRLKPDPKDFEIRRNNPITQPLLWTSLRPTVPGFKRTSAAQVFKPDGAFLFSDDFQDAALKPWNFSEDDRYSLLKPNPERIRVVDAPLLAGGKKAVRLEVKRGPNSFRSEISLPSENGFNERWYAARMLVPEDWTLGGADGNDIVLQWHAVPGNGKPTYPNLEISIGGDRWFVRQSYGDAHEKPTRANTKLEEPMKRGTWVSWVIHAKWSPEEAGLLEIWKDGKSVYERKGPNVYGTIGEEYTPYLKTGLYHPEWKRGRAKALSAGGSGPDTEMKRTVYVRDVKIGGPKATLQEMSEELK